MSLWANSSLVLIQVSQLQINVQWNLQRENTEATFILMVQRNCSSFNIFIFSNFFLTYSNKTLKMHLYLFSVWKLRAMFLYFIYALTSSDRCTWGQLHQLLLPFQLRLLSLRDASWPSKFSGLTFKVHNL